MVGSPCHLFGVLFLAEKQIDWPFCCYQLLLLISKRKVEKKAAGKTNPLNLDNFEPADVSRLVASGGLNLKVIAEAEGLKVGVRVSLHSIIFLRYRIQIDK